MKLVKTKRTISWNTYLMTLVISITLFGAGIYVGMKFEEVAKNEMEGRLETIDERMITMQTLFILEDSPMFCEFFSKEMDKFDSETVSVGKKIQFMEEKQGIDPELKTQYMLLELRDYLLMKRIKERCNDNSIIVLYFVNSSGCNDCWAQSWILTDIRENVPIRLYTFDLGINGEITAALHKSYNIRTYPTIIINETTIFDGLTDREKLLDFLNLLK